MWKVGGRLEYFRFQCIDSDISGKPEVYACAMQLNDIRSKVV